MRHLRLPAEDLDDLVQWNRLNLARKEGLGVTGVWLWHDELQLTEAVGPYRDRLEAVEIQVPGSLWTDDNCVSAIKSCSRQVGLPITLAPLKAQERTSGHFHPRTRVGYHSSDLAPLKSRLAEAGMYLDRVLCHLDANESAWEEALEFIGHLPLSQIGNLDLLLSLSGFDEQVHAMATGEALLTVVTHSGCRLFLDPLVDVDRSSDVNFGLLDRLSNPRSFFNALRRLNTILFSEGQKYHPFRSKEVGTSVVGVENPRRRLLFLPPDRDKLPVSEIFNGIGAQEELVLYELVAATCRRMAAKPPWDGRPSNQPRLLFIENHTIPRK